jgi:hypothetical protein
MQSRCETMMVANSDGGEPTPPHSKSLIAVTWQTQSDQ